jgi:hypothetical protein
MTFLYVYFSNSLTLPTNCHIISISMDMLALFPDKQQAHQFEKWLLERVPDLKDSFAKAHENEGELESSYAVFSYGVRPYIEQLFQNNSEKELSFIWKLLEDIAYNGEPEIKNELFVMLEELDLWNFYDFMGPLLREQWFRDITTYSEKRDRNTPMNTHVNTEKYNERWTEEIKKIGGFKQLTNEELIRIRTNLWAEFGIERWYPKGGTKQFKIIRFGKILTLKFSLNGVGITYKYHVNVNFYFWKPTMTIFSPGELTVRLSLFSSKPFLWMTENRAARIRGKKEIHLV